MHPVPGDPDVVTSCLEAIEVGFWGRKHVAARSILVRLQLADHVIENRVDLLVQRGIGPDRLFVGLSESGQVVAHGVAAEQAPAAFPAAVEGDSARRVLALRNGLESSEQPIGIQSQQVVDIDREELLQVRVRHADLLHVELLQLRGCWQRQSDGAQQGEGGQYAA